MPTAQIKKTILIFSILFTLAIGVSYGYEDGFGPAKKVEGDHFTIYYSPELETAFLMQQLNLGPSDAFLTGETVKGPDSPIELTDMVDTLFARVCDVLDMELYSYKGDIKVCKNFDQLKAIYKTLFDRELTKQSFYVNDLNTIYISEEFFKPEILGHEIAHAVISHYFVVLPSVKIQEVLATYVEYQLRKSAK
ncbi:MAG: hypothetical protein NTW64_02035 [Candidatus Omnitrophica bacterium]|nr:hypothetical protein [Candidatus Omnitrophota bacterium]